MSLYNKDFGKEGENIAVEYLLNHSFKIINRNFRSKFGEIDVIAQKNKKIYFLEVKTRANLNKGKPYEAVTPRKVRQLKKAISYFLLTNKFKNYKYTIAVMSIIMENMKDSTVQFYESIE